MTKRRKLDIVLIYNGDKGTVSDTPEDRGSSADLRKMIRDMARALRRYGHRVTTLAMRRDLVSFQRRLRRLNPDVVFSQYEDVIHGALYEMRVAALIQMMGYRLTGSPPLALGLYRYKGMASSLLHGADVPLPGQTRLLERVRDVDGVSWEFPVIIQPSQEHSGIGMDRDSIVTSKSVLKRKVSECLRTYSQPALVQSFLPGREFNVSVVGGRRLRVLPLAEVDYSRLSPGLPPIMSYAAKFLENTAEYEGTSVICPAVVGLDLAREIGSTALRAFRAVGGWGYGRVDIRLDAAGQPRVLEVNCNPCLEEGVGLARSAAQAGMAYPQLLDLIVRAALERQPFDVSVSMYPALTRTPGKGAVPALQSRTRPV